MGNTTVQRTCGKEEWKPDGGCYRLPPTAPGGEALAYPVTAMPSPAAPWVLHYDQVGRPYWYNGVTHEKIYLPGKGCPSSSRPNTPCTGLLEHQQHQQQYALQGSIPAFAGDSSGGTTHSHPHQPYLPNHGNDQHREVATGATSSSPTMMLMMVPPPTSATQYPVCVGVGSPGNMIPHGSNNQPNSSSSSSSSLSSLGSSSGNNNNNNNSNNSNSNNNSGNHSSNNHNNSNSNNNTNNIFVSYQGHYSKPVDPYHNDCGRFHTAGSCAQGGVQCIRPAFAPTSPTSPFDGTTGTRVGSGDVLVYDPWKWREGYDDARRARFWWNRETGERVFTDPYD